MTLVRSTDISAFYETFPAEEALALAQRFEFYFTPQRASWLNMIEIEFSALSRQGLKRRIPTREIREREVFALVEEREQKAIKINWHFSLEKARTTFEKDYESMSKNAR